MPNEIVETTYPNGTVVRKLINTDPVVTSSPIRIITTQAWYRRLTVTERKALREGATDAIADFRDDLMRSIYVNLDGMIEAQLLAIGSITQTRIDELLVDGIETET